MPAREDCLHPRAEIASHRFGAAGTPSGVCRLGEEGPVLRLDGEIANGAFQLPGSVRQPREGSGLIVHQGSLRSPQAAGSIRPRFNVDHADPNSASVGLHASSERLTC